MKYKLRDYTWCIFFYFAENGYRNVRFHVVRYLQQFSTEDETKIRETVSNIVGCSIEYVRVHGYLYSSSFFIVLSIKEIYIERLFAMQQHDKERLSQLSIDYFKDDFNTLRLEQTAGIIWIIFESKATIFLFIYE